MELKIRKGSYRPVVTEDDLIFLSCLYGKVKTNKLFRKRWKTFEKFVDEYITNESKKIIQGLNRKG